MSLYWPNATPTVAAVSAGASLMPSPRKSVDAFAVSVRTRASLPRGLSSEHLGDAHLLGQVPYFRAAIARDQQHAIEAMPPPEMRDERRAVDARLVTEAARGGVAIVNHHHALHAAHGVRQLRAQTGMIG